jgi:hypothetical protein
MIPDLRIRTGPHLQALFLTENARTAQGPVTYARAFAELA